MMQRQLNKGHIDFFIGCLFMSDYFPYFHDLSGWTLFTGRISILNLTNST